jgi:UPF0755 protein
MTKLLKIFSVLFILIAILAVGIGVYAMKLLQPVAATQVVPTKFIIPKGQAISIIGNRLEDEGFIKSGLVFRLVVKQSALESKIQSGTFEVAPSMTALEIAKQFTVGADDVWVTIPEGWRAEEIAASVDKLSLPAFDPEEFIDLARPDEGMLFPDSYLIPREYTATQLHSLLINTFETKITDDLAAEFAASSRDPRDVLIMASIVEREGRGFEQMQHIAGILWNRIDIDMALQVDASLQYVEGYNKTQKGWWTPPTIKTKQTDSPFNTYMHPGLPPRPIANPGLDAILATLTPEESDDIFYLHSRAGKVYYAQTLEGHNANINRYLR